MKKINVNVIPSSGYIFVEKDGTTLQGTGNWRSVIDRVVAYRKRNKLPPGDPRAEVRDQACAREPNNCHESEDPVYMKALKVASLKGRVLAFLSSLRGRQAAGGLTFVSEELMRARVSVCAGCPVHAAVSGGCGSCKKAVSLARKEIIGGRPVDERGAGCLVLGEDTAINAWLGDPTVSNGELPACCWRRIS